MQSHPAVLRRGRPSKARRYKSFGSGAVLLLRHLTCGRVPTRSRTIMPHARGAAPARRDPPETLRHLAAKDEDGRVSPALMPLTATLLFLRYGRVVSALISTPSGST